MSEYSACFLARYHALSYCEPTLIHVYIDYCTLYAQYVCALSAPRPTIVCTKSGEATNSHCASC